jgi:hypothetical protein
MDVKRQSRKLAGSPIYFDHMITAEQQQLRAAQWPQIEEAKVKGIKWSWSDIAPHKLVLGVIAGSRVTAI